MATVGLLNVISFFCTLFGHVPESSKHILLECEPLDFGRRRIVEGKQPGKQINVYFRDKILELVKYHVSR